MRLLSYNIHKGVGGRDRRCRLERIIEVLESKNSDLMCLQEVTRGARRSRYDNQPRRLANHFHAVQFVYQTNIHYKVGGYGNLLLSRWPLRVSHQISLQMERKKSRGAQLVVVETPEGPLHLVNCHLGLAEKERHWQINHLLRHHLFRESANLPTLIVGDMNDWRNSLRTGTLASHEFHQATHPPSRFCTFPAWLPAGSLDKAFANNQIIVRHAQVVRTALAKRASDHLPILIDFHLKPPA